MVENYFSSAFSFIRLCVKVHTFWVETVSFSSAGKVTRRWQRKWPVFGVADAEPQRDAGYLSTAFWSWPPPRLEDGEHRMSLVAVADTVRSMQTCKETDGGTQMPKQKQRGFFFSSFFPPSVHLVIRTFSAIGRDCEGRWLHQMLSQTNKSANMDTFDFTPCHVGGGRGVLICSLHCINRHCPHTAVKNPCKTTHTFNTLQIHWNTRSKRLFQTIKLSFLRSK